MPHNSDTNDVFVMKLQQLAKEQRELVEHGLFPDWMGSVNAAIARNALPFVMGVSLVIATIFFVVFFAFFFALESRLV